MKRIRKPSGLLHIILCVVISFYSFGTSASIEGHLIEKDVMAMRERAINVSLNQATSGALLIIRGRIIINGNVAIVGQTVLSGSTITTDIGGEAIIELGSLGLIWIREKTTIVLIFTSNVVQLRSECNSTRIEVRYGQVEVNLPKKETLGPYNSETYLSSVALSTKGNTGFIIDCSGKIPDINKNNSSPKSLIAMVLLGVGASILWKGGAGGEGDGLFLSNLLP